ncbi:MAG TPA: J domain-containing protein [Streptosporangiaceae bacterium]
MTATDERPAAQRAVDAFRVLGLPYSPDLTDEEVRAAYLLRLRAVHPDNGGDAGATAAVTAAYDALRSGVRRGELLAAVTVDREPAPVPVRPAWWRAARPGVRVVPGRARAGCPMRRGERSCGGRWRRRGSSRAGRHTSPTKPPWTRSPTCWWSRWAGASKASTTPARLGQMRWSGLASPRCSSRPPWRWESRRQYATDRERAGTGPAVPMARSWLVRGWLRVRYGRPWWLAARVVLAALAVVIAQVAAPGDPAM